MASDLRLTLFAIVLAVAGASAGRAQSYNKVPEAPKPPANADRARADAEAKRAAAEDDRERAQAEAQRSATAGGVGFNANYLSSFHIPAAITDDFARTAAPVYLLPNGVRLRTSGEFRPNEGVRCVLYCETALRR
jgi:hypothetical protein